MDFKRYLSESEFAASNPVAGDQFNIVVNEVVNIQTSVVENSADSVTLKLDDKAKSVLEGVGVIFEAPSTHTYVSGRDFNIDAEYNGYVMGDESIDDSDGFTKYGYGVYKFVKTTQFEHNGKIYKQNHYRRVCDLIDPSTGKEPSPYTQGYEKMFRFTVDQLTKKNARVASMGETKDMSEIAALRRLSGLNEGYEDRVMSIANKIISYSQDGAIKKDDVDRLIKSMAHDVPEYRMADNPKSKAWPDFVRDVKRQLAGKVRWNNGAAARAAANNDKLAQIAQVIQDAVSNSFPDGDPFDTIMPKLSRMGIDSYEMTDWLDKAAKKYLGAKGYYNYLHTVWQDFMNDNPGQYGLTDNPWNESLDEDQDFIIGDRVRHKENGKIGRVVGDPEGDEYPVEFDDEKGEAYYCDAPVLELVESLAETKIADRIVSVTKELEAKKAAKKSGKHFNTKIDDVIASLTRELKTLQKRKPVAESKLKIFAETKDGIKLLNFGSSAVNVLKSNVSGSVVMHQVSESVNKSTPWVCKVTTRLSVGSAFIPRG